MLEEFINKAVRDALILAGDEVAFVETKKPSHWGLTFSKEVKMKRNGKHYNIIRAVLTQSNNELLFLLMPYNRNNEMPRIVNLEDFSVNDRIDILNAILYEKLNSKK